MATRYIVSNVIVVAALPALASPASAAPVTRCFQQGVNDYWGTYDTELDAALPDIPVGDFDHAAVDHHDGEQQALIRFEDVFGEGDHQVPLDATILSSQLTFHVVDPGDCGADLHRMLVSWSEDDTWNSMVNGVQIDDVEAASAIDGSLTSSVSVGDVVTIDLAVGTLESWQTGQSSNFGWLLKWHNTMEGGWAFASSEAAGDVSRHPRLCVEYVVPEPGTLSLLALGGVAAVCRRRSN